MDIKKNLTTQNYDIGTTARIKYIVVHYTGNNGDTALANTNYFKSYRGASAHYFVDENSIYQSIEDKNIAWHCGAKTYAHSQCRNYNSIGVEMCSYINSNGKYDFKAKTIENAIWLVKNLMKKYNVPIKNVIRHYDVTKKLCPEPYVRDIKAWENFKVKLEKTDSDEKKEHPKEDDEMVTETNLNANGKDIKVNRILKDGKNFIEVAGLKNAGFDVGYNADTKLVTIENSVKELPLTVDGKNTKVEAVNIKGHNFCLLRSLAAATGLFEVDFENGDIILKKNK